MVKKQRGRRVARGRKVAGKARSGWEGDSYPEGAMTRGPLSTKRKLRSQDDNGQLGSHKSLTGR